MPVLRAAVTGALYFAYGSNLASAQMRSRCPSARVLAPARLHGFRPEFIQPHEEWGGGVLGLVAARGGVTHGVLYALDHADLDMLDAHEPVASGRYWREEHPVALPDGATRRAWVYFGAIFPQSPYVPASRYLEVVLAGASEHGLPAAFIDWLRASAAARAGEEPNDRADEGH